MKKPKVLVSAPYAMPVIDLYKSQLEAVGYEVVVAEVQERLNEAQLLEIISDIDGIICGDDQITALVMDRAPRLKVISKWGTGIDSIDVEAAVKRGIAVKNTPNAFSEPVADTTMGHILNFARQLMRMNQDIRAGRWEKPQLVALNETTLGIIGVGNCGKAVARRAVAFGMRLLGNDLVTMPEDFLEATGIQMVSLEQLLSEADFVTLHTTLNPTAYHLMNEKRLARMKSTAYLINTSRGPVVDEKALICALEENRIAGAALDVFEEEPLPHDSPLRRLPHCCLAPHNSNSSRSAAQKVHENTIRNLLEVLT